MGECYGRWMGEGDSQDCHEERKAGVEDVQVGTVGRERQ